MAVHPLPSTLVTSPSSATAGGTPLTGIEDNSIEFEDGVDVLHVCNDIEPDAYITIRKPGKPPYLRFRLKDNSAAARAILYSLLTSAGSIIQSRGTGTTGLYKGVPATPMVLRPTDTVNGLYLYSSRWVRREGSYVRWLAHRVKQNFAESDVIFTPEASLDGAKQAFMLAPAANINSHYFP